MYLGYLVKLEIIQTGQMKHVKYNLITIKETIISKTLYSPALLTHADSWIMHHACGETCPLHLLHIQDNIKDRKQPLGISKLPDCKQNKLSGSEEMILLIHGMCSRGHTAEWCKRKYYFA